MFTRLTSLLSLALLLITPASAWAGSICGKIQTIGAESLEDSAYLVLTIQSCQQGAGGCRAHVLACLLGTPFGRLASALAQSAQQSGTEVVAAFDEDPQSPLDARRLRSLSLSGSPFCR